MESCLVERVYHIMGHLNDLTILLSMSPSRRWVLQHILHQFPPVGHGKNQQQGDAETTQNSSDRLARTLQQEIKVCSDAASRYPSNYNAWSHRIWVLQRMAKGNIKV